MDDVADQQLINRMTEGDSSALAEFYDLHAPTVLGFLVRLLPTRADADDVLQEVFWQVWKTAGRYDPERAKPRSWLFMMARSRAMDCLRRTKTTEAAAIELEPARGEEPIGEVERQESGVRVRRALSQLPEDQRQAIRLSFYEGFAHKDIAERLRIPLGTAKTRIRLGMRRLRDLLAESESIDTPVVGRLAR